MYRRNFTRWLSGLVLPVAIFSLLTGCSSSSLFQRSDSAAQDSSPYSETENIDLTEYPTTYENLLESMPTWMADADLAWSNGDSTTAEELSMKSILAIQEVLVKVPDEARPSMVDTLVSWKNLYEDRFKTTLDDLIATEEGLVDVLSNEEAIMEAESLLVESKTDTFVFRIDTTIVEVDRLPDIPEAEHKKINQLIKYFTENPRGRKAMTVWLERAGEMIPRMAPILHQHGVPEDLIFLSMIESGFRTDARSWARAVGPWQFIYSTGKVFDLEADWWYDERRDPEKATHAAARLLRQLYEHSGDWYLAFAGYNYGEGRVARKIRYHGTRDFWKLHRLPKQTRNYVPTFLAARRIAKNPEEYGFEPIKYRKPVERDTVLINEPVELGALADALKVELDVLRKLNPALIRWCTPPTRTETEVYLPKGYGKDFDNVFASIPQEKKTSWVRHKIRRGESLSVIAKKYKSSVRAIMDLPANNIKNPARIKEGNYLLIPVAPGGVKGNYSHLYAMDDPELPDGSQKRTHVVRRGDTLSQIAERYHVGLSKLLRWNGLSKRSMIYPGQKLVLYQRNTYKSSSSKPKVTTTSAPPTSPAGDEQAGSTIDGGIVHYKVRYGDSPWTIAQKHRISLESLLEANGLSKRAVIHPGDILRIPPQRLTSDGKVVYKVQQGDTLWDIAGRFKVSVNDLQSWNNLIDSNQLQPGDRLIVYLQGNQ